MSTLNDYRYENNSNFIEEKLKNGDVRKYVKGKFLGKGGFAKCYEFTIHGSNQVLASKIIPKASLNKSRAKQKLMSEIKIHRKLNHTNIVKFTHSFEDHENVYILLELCQNQTMNELVRRRKRLTELEVQCYMQQIMNSIDHLHKERVIHRDLKLGNLFLSDKMEIKLGDFGLATTVEHEGERKRTICGTPNYIAPEILEGSKRGHSYEVDIWSVGVIMFTLLTGKPPFETNDVKTTYRRIKQNAYSFPETIPVSDVAKNLVKSILQTDPAKRPSISQIMNHGFFKNGGKIPDLLPVSTVACPPSASYVRQFLPSSRSAINNLSPRKMESTAPINHNSNGFLKERTDFMNTDRTGQQQQFKKYDYNNINNNKLSTKDQQQLTGNGGDLKHTQTHENLNSMRTSYDSKFAYLSKMGKSSNTRTEANLNLKSTNFPTQPSSTLKPNSQITQQQSTSDVWVSKHVDYASKYGLGYILNTGAAGAFFNDSTKIILDSDGKRFEYIERKGEDKIDIVTTHTLQNYPKELQKKVTLLQHFKSYLQGEKQSKENAQPSSSTQAGSEQQQNTENSEKPSNETKTQAQNIYVKKWLKTKHAILFRLSNKVVQVIFQDQTQIILSSELKIVTYVNKKAERKLFPLADALLESQNQEMSKRLKYTKDILTHMLGNQNQGRSSNNKNGENNSRQNKHTSSSSHDKVQNQNQQQQASSLNKYTPSVDSKQNYATNPIYSSLGKLKNSQKDDAENIQSQVSTRMQMQKQVSSHGFNMTGSGFNGVKGGQYDNLYNMQLLKSQSTAGRMSVHNPQTNNYMGNSGYNYQQNQRKTEIA